MSSRHAPLVSHTTDQGTTMQQELERVHHPRIYKLQLKDGITSVMITEPHIKGEETLEDFKRDLTDLHFEGPSMVVIDCQNVKSMNAEGIEALRRLGSFYRHGGGALAIHSVPPHIDGALRDMFLHKSIHIEATADAAIQRVRTP